MLLPIYKEEFEAIAGWINENNTVAKDISFFILSFPYFF
jgi:hypothetical protein